MLAALHRKRGFAFVRVDAHLDPEFSSYETRKRHGFVNRKPLRIDAQLIAIRCTVIHDPHREAEFRKISCEEIDRNDLRVAGVEPLADFRERRMRDGSEIVSRPGSARGAPHELCELRVLPIDQTLLSRPVMDAEAPARRRLSNVPSPSSEPTINSRCRESSASARARRPKCVSTTNSLPSVLPRRVSPI